MAQRLAHFMGIGGIGMSALVRMLLEDGWRVTGCDLRLSHITEELEQLGVRCVAGHGPEHLAGADLLVFTAAVPPDHPELAAAYTQGIRVLRRNELLGEIMAGKRGVAVAGTHGKTTTSSLLGLVLMEAGLDPTVIVGGEVPELGGNARKGSGDLLVAEADEFAGSFLALRPELAVVTNIEPEHLDYYGDFATLVRAFQQFLALVPAHGHIVACIDDPVLAGLRSGELREPSGDLAPWGQPAEVTLSPQSLATSSIITYGFHPTADWRPEQLQPNDLGGTDFLAVHHGRALGQCSLAIPGRHNVSNALAVLAASDLLGVDISAAQRLFSRFHGVKRRFQVLGEAQGITVVDDYAHHPTEVRATLAAARARYPDRRIRCVFQPHTFSRTKLLMPLFVEAFADADAVCITEIYAAREENTWDVSGHDLAQAIHHPDVTFVPTLDEAIAHEQAALQPGDVLLALGAGDVYRVAEQVLQALEGDHAAH